MQCVVFVFDLASAILATIKLYGVILRIVLHHVAAQFRWTE